MAVLHALCGHRFLVLSAAMITNRRLTQDLAPWFFIMDGGDGHEG